MDILFISERIYFHDRNDFINGGILVTQEGKIREILQSSGDVNTYLYRNQPDETYDFGNKIIMPGLIDSSVYISEPGRPDWEGFISATKAAAAGGFTTIVDMPITSIPPTTTVENFKTKLIVARGKLYVDVAFWGGFVPDSNSDNIEKLVKGGGVVGIQCLLSPYTGIQEFQHINKQQLEHIFSKLSGSETIFAFHAQQELDASIEIDESEPKKYESYLRTRPESLEMNGIKLITDLAIRYNVKVHINHLSSGNAIPIIREARKNLANLSVETCHHYLTFSVENIADTQTEFKSDPPIRDKDNQLKLWEAIKDGDIDMIVSDHSPATPGQKMQIFGKNRGNFLRAWSGIASLQFGLAIQWTNFQKNGLTIRDLHKLMCENPAKLCGIYNVKGKIEIGYDADFCIWDPDEEFTVTEDLIFFKNKKNPYMGMKLRGVVEACVVRGFHVYQRYEQFGQPLGQVILRKACRKVVTFT